jgi:hypothetical protein
MAFMRTANARVTKSSLEVNDWRDIRKGSLGGKMRVSSDSSVFKDYSPDKYLLTHCTIIASVDVDSTGPVNKKGWHYQVTPETEQYINNNEDCWERDLLLSCFHTFRGAENYVEHIQIPELSKGKIVDAVARDLGETVYVDILVATDRKHKDLVASIEKGEMTTLSMGCTVEYTICTKCGNVAHDDTDTCSHIKYQKGNHFFDNRARRHRIAELCGHKSDPQSVNFIEASWVANPAFKGAVMRNIIQDAGAETAEKIKGAFELEREVDESAMLRAASDVEQIKAALDVVNNFVSKRADFNFDDEGGEEDAGGEAEADTPPMDQLTDDVKQFIRDRVKRELRDETRGVDRDKADQGEADKNESLVRSNFAFNTFKAKYAHVGSDLALYRLYEGLVSVKTAGWKSLSNKGFTGREILALSHFLDRERGDSTLSKKAYDAIAQVGGTNNFDDPMDYLTAVGKAAGIRVVPTDVARMLIYKGNLYNYGS